MPDSNPRSVSKRIATAVYSTERRRVYRGESHRPRWSGRGAQGLLVLTGIVTTTVTAREPDGTLGTGQVTLFTGEGITSETLSTDPLDVIDVANDYAVAFPESSTKRAKIHFERGLWRILTREC